MVRSSEHASGQDAVVVVAHDRYALQRAPFRFGRASQDGVIGLDPTDRGISRHAGRISIADMVLTLLNESAKRPLFVEHAWRVRHVRVEPGSSYSWSGTARVLVPGNVHTHLLDVETPTPASDHEPAASGEGSTLDIVLSDAERTAVRALASGYLARWPRHDENPLGYEAAARLIELDVTTVRRRIEHLRDRLNATGVVDATGPHAARVLVEYLIDAGVITTDVNLPKADR